MRLTPEWNALLGVERRAIRPIPILWISFGPWTCSGPRRRERESSTPPHLSARPRGSRWHALCSLETGVEEARRILQSRSFGEGHLHDVLVRLTRADHAVVRPHRNPSPLPLLDDFGVGFLDQGTEPAEHLAPPVAQLLDFRVDQLRGDLVFCDALFFMPVSLPWH